MFIVDIHHSFANQVHLTNYTATCSVQDDGIKRVAKNHDTVLSNAAFKLNRYLSRKKSVINEKVK